MILIRCVVPMQGIAWGEVREVDETDEHIAGLLRAEALVPLDPPKPRGRTSKRTGQSKR